jgi:hypothetical protein
VKVKIGPLDVLSSYDERHDSEGDGQQDDAAITGWRSSLR